MYMSQYTYTTMYCVMCAHFMFGTDITADFIVTKRDLNSGYSELTNNLDFMISCLLICTQ